MVRCQFHVKCYCCCWCKAYLDEPEHVVGVELVLAVPGGQDVPLHLLAAVDGDAVLGMLVLAGLQVHQHLLRQLRQEAPMQNVVLHQPTV